MQVHLSAGDMIWINHAETESFLDVPIEGGSTDSPLKEEEEVSKENEVKLAPPAGQDHAAGITGSQGGVTGLWEVPAAPSWPVWLRLMAVV